MREAERREQAALDYAKGVEEKRQDLEKVLKKLMLIMLKNLRQVFIRFRSCTKRISAAIESGDAQAQVEANKRIATLLLRMQN